MSIGSRTHEEFMEEARAFHGYPAPGLIIGGYMVELAKRHMPEGVLYDAVSETAHCLPDAVQLLTPCTFGNGWLRVLPFGIYAVTLYDKATGEGVRVELDNDKLEPYDAIRSWFLKERPKKEQDTERLQAQIKEAGESILSFRKVRIRQDMLGHRSFGAITRCPLCGSHYPASYGGICRSCQGQSPYEDGPGFALSQQPRMPRHDADHPGQGKGCRVRRRAGAFRRRHLPPPANGQKPRLRSGKHAASRGLGA